MAEQKKYLSLDGLHTYDDNIKTYVDTQINDHTHSFNDLEDKPFGEEFVLLEEDGEKVENLTITTTKDADSSYGEYIIDIFWGIGSFMDNPYRWNKFIVYFDNIEYNCTLKYLVEDDEYVIGNGSIISPDEEDTGEPFCIHNYWSQPSRCSYLMVCTKDAGTHTITMYIGNTVQLDEKYIPDSIKVRIGEVEDVLTGKAENIHNHDDAYDTIGAADAALESAKYYADSVATTAANTVKNELLNGAGEAYDTLQELGKLIDENHDAIDALETIASGKADATHSHAISDVSGLQNALDAKVAQASFDSHDTNTTKHITSTERTNWNAAKTHADSAHAPSNAQANVIESIKVNGTAQTITSKAVDITVPTKASDIGAAESSHTHAISDITDLQTTLNNAASAISTNTSSISTHTDKISALEEKVGDGFTEISSAEIQALFQ